jgi:hypothetical protein
VLTGSGCFGAGLGEGEVLVAEVGDDLQAAAGAMLAPAPLSLLSATFPHRDERGTAFR